MERLFLRWLIAGLFLNGLPLLAAELAVGDAVPPITAKDQNDVPYTFTNGTRYLLIATEMGCATAANHKLAEQGAGYLEKHGAVYLMDIHTMPGIARVFALPKMRKYPHRIVLADTAEGLNWVPVKAGQVAVLSLTEAGRVKKISHWNPASGSVTNVWE